MIIAIVQARLGSTRLPGKVVREIAGKPMLAYMLERLALCRSIARTVVAVPQKDASEIAGRVGPFCPIHLVGVSGDENDVHRRYIEVLGNDQCRGVTQFVRLCADSPLIDPMVVDHVVSGYFASWPGNMTLVRGKALIASNTRPKTWPAGQCVEVVDVAGFRTGTGYRGRVGRDAPHEDPMTDHDREHVLGWYYRNCPTVNITCPAGDFSGSNMCVDTLEEFDHIKQVIERMDRPHWTAGWRELVDLIA